MKVEAGFEPDDEAKPKLPTISDELRAVADKLDEEVSTTHCRWKIFRQLFVLDKDRGQHEARYGLMNAVAPDFFSELRDMMIDAVFLDICRLTENSQMYAKGDVVENVVIDQLSKAVESMADPNFASLVDHLNNCHHDVKAKCAPLRVHRNKRISHLDMAILLSPSTNVLPDVPIQMIEDALQAIREYVNDFRRDILGSTTYYERADSTDDGDNLIEILKRAYAFASLALFDESLRKRKDEAPFGKA